MAMTPEERKARDAERKRRKRAEERAERDARAATSRTRADTGPAPTTMRDAVDGALAAMKWLAPSDVAAVTQAKDLARIVDESTHSGDEARALSAHRALSRVLNDLGGTPTVRMQHELRSLKLAKRTEDADGGNESSEGGRRPENVTELKRPPKRAWP
ncbi:MULTISPECIES: terminase small subunit [unclassified Microbacterium]|uniref:terminase small subunit n=1 Tax=Microbacterium TaxID=33882 RepID=UPI003BA048ED